jgi:hypothetical protein
MAKGPNRKALEKLAAETTAVLARHPRADRRRLALLRGQMVRDMTAIILEEKKNLRPYLKVWREIYLAACQEALSKALQTPAKEEQPGGG